MESHGTKRPVVELHSVCKSWGRAVVLEESP